MKTIILNEIKDKKDEIFSLSTLCGKCENYIAKILFQFLNWDLSKKGYNGLFGWRNFDTDKCRKIGDDLLVIEVKKVTEKKEYGYWHALIQGLIYSYQQTELSDGDFIVLCIILDWGRGADNFLNDKEKQFIDQFQNNNIFFVRVSMLNNKFIEHNINTNWEVIMENVNG